MLCYKFGFKTANPKLSRQQVKLLNSLLAKSACVHTNVESAAEATTGVHVFWDEVLSSTTYTFSGYDEVVWRMGDLENEIGINPDVGINPDLS